MVTQKDSWLPDVCTCYLEYDYDRAKGWAGGVRVTKTKKCPAHAGVPDRDLHAVIWAETQTKSAAIREMKAVSSVLVASDMLVVPWRFAGEGRKRALIIRAGDMLMESEKAILQTVFDSNIGDGRVTVT